jgi:hypothetical protein
MLYLRERHKRCCHTATIAAVLKTMTSLTRQCCAQDVVYPACVYTISFEFSLAAVAILTLALIKQRLSVSAVHISATHTCTAVLRHSTCSAALSSDPR